METSRRGLLGLLLAAPVAAKGAVDTVVAEGMTMKGRLGMIPGVGNGRILRGTNSGTDAEACEDLQSAKPMLSPKGQADFYRKRGIPNWLREDWRQTARRQTNYKNDLLPEVTCLKSANHTMQRTLQLRLLEQRAEREFFNDLHRQAARDSWYAWAKRFKSFRLPWL